MAKNVLYCGAIGNTNPSITPGNDVRGLNTTPSETGL